MGPFDESVLNLRVLPNDVDVTRVTTDRYTALTELGRIDMMLRLGISWTALKRRWAPVSRINTIRFRYPLALLHRVSEGEVSHVKAFFTPRNSCRASPAGSSC